MHNAHELAALQIQKSDSLFGDVSFIGIKNCDHLERRYMGTCAESLGLGVGLDGININFEGDYVGVRPPLKLDCSFNVAEHGNEVVSVVSVTGHESVYDVRTFERLFMTEIGGIKRVNVEAMNPILHTAIRGSICAKWLVAHPDRITQLLASPKNTAYVFFAEEEAQVSFCM